MPDEAAHRPVMRESATWHYMKGKATGEANGLDGDWGYCKHCQFLVPLVPVPWVNAGCLEPHSAGHYAPRMVCGYEGEKPSTPPLRMVIGALERADIRVEQYIRSVNTRDPREEN